ncbi:MAG: dienelactone hydrolase family protein [Bacteroidota bacterium]
MRDPHTDQPLVAAGAPLDAATGAVVFLHGRGATARSILMLADEAAPDRSDLAYLAPQAAPIGYGPSWYPYSFLAPMTQNEPYLSSALARIGAVLHDLEVAGLDRSRVLLVGFSQGACLASEYVARHPQRYGGLCALSGGVIGPPGTPRDYEGSLDGTPVFLGCSDIDPHIPLARVEETGEVMRHLGANLDQRIYAGMGHTVNAEEIAILRQMMEALPVRAPSQA